ncbi:pilus assembly protein TadG-related protein [Rugamonas aquatica]|uniref:Pilus assembly protein TadE n=1 Tax=Rugamonas aquatica TaxID=2743357 RepID=A0A6A7N3J5_9BURK|nr:pilus assembly protein TadG-related protein [Rugamonas aquatica]MQA39613.1 pilus assembly protein TadE [Rugamonas aquatica]
MDTHRRRPRRQRGAFAMMFGIALLGLLLFVGMALDLGQLYNRKAELQLLADATALAAARELNGTASGVASALTKAATAASELHYQHGQLSFTWSSAALRFSATPDAAGPWMDAASAQGAPDGLLYVRADTSALNAAYGQVATVFMRALSSTLANVATSASATAGRLTIAATPLAVCALSATPAAARLNPGPPAQNELVEYGFRRGVAYDLMRLNASGLTAEHFVIDPLSPPGAAGSAANTADSVTGPYVCSGTLQIPRLQGGAVTVTRGFPLATLYQQLNSRFDQYTGGACSANGAPPDANIKAYAYATITWMSTPRTMQSAKSYSDAGHNKLWTVADPLPSPAGTVNADYGALWSYARAVPYSAYTPGAAEPAGGYTPFAASAWVQLYSPGAPAAPGYPALPPYQALGGANFQAPSSANLPGQRLRRVLNVALLACPVAGGGTVGANVLAVGKFFMTVPATATALHAEFAGAVPDQALGGAIELLP